LFAGSQVLPCKVSNQFNHDKPCTFFDFPR
jgi:hypothetical protein